MKKIIVPLLLLIMMVSLAFQRRQKQDLKVFISVDMEGIAGVVSGRECGASGHDYDYFRRLMTLETNAAIEGALEAGVTQIIVRDGHGAKTNVLPDLLHEKAELLRGVTQRPENMMLGIDASFDAVLFIGYHAKAGTEDGVIAHTSSGNVVDLSINGVSLPEAGYNALIAGMYDVPVILVAGDNWICEQSKSLFGDITCIQTKVGMGSAALGLHPSIVQQRIRSGVKTALGRLNEYRPYRLIPPYQMVLKVKQVRGSYPDAKKTGPGEFTYTSPDLLKVMDAFNALK